MMALAAIPAPLYPLYQRRLDLSLTALACVFAAYMVGVASALPLGGRLSDHYGRRVTLASGGAAAGAATVLFLATPALAGLVTARLLSGMAVGLVSLAATTQLLDLWPSRIGASRSVGETVATLANLGGIGVGAVAGSLALGLSSSPLSVPYRIYAIVLAGFGTAAVLATDGQRRRVGSGSTPRASARSVRARHELRVACLGAFTVFATLGYFSSLAPVFLAGQHAEVTSVLPALVIAGPFVASAVVQTSVVNVEGSPTVLGLVLVPLGLVVTTASLAASQTWTFVAGAVVAGAGCGVVFRRSLRRVSVLSAGAERGSLTSRFLLAGYLGPIVPIVVLGVVADLVTPLTASGLFAAGIGVCCALLLADLRRTPPRRRDADRPRANNQVTTRGTIQ
ncbi:MFS transporter [Nocardioides sp.]|uniref:MFS transporter n=1 Tax=Nocardioides sp. TaxID=35761 RepID=UPI002620AE83|nr:MFS transporter [Nocardioides sp.]